MSRNQQKRPMIKDLKIRRRALHKAYEQMQISLQAAGDRGMTMRQLIEAFLPRLSAAERRVLRGDTGYYESREGPYDWVVDDARKLRVVKACSYGYAIGPRKVPSRRH